MKIKTILLCILFVCVILCLWSFRGAAEKPHISNINIGSERKSVTAKDLKNRRRYRLIDGEGFSVDLYAANAPEHISSDKIDYVVADIVFDRKNEKLILCSYELQDIRKALSDKSVIPVVVNDCIIYNNRMRFLIQDGICLKFVDVKLDAPYGVYTSTDIYNIKWVPPMYIGILTSAEFLTPDIIRITNSQGVVIHQKIDFCNQEFRLTSKYEVISYLMKKGMSSEEAKYRTNIRLPICKTVWWNKKGDPFFMSVRSKNKESFGDTEPRYKKNGLTKCIRMNREIRQSMQRESDLYAENLGLPEEPRLQITPKRK